MDNQYEDIGSNCKEKTMFKLYLNVNIKHGFVETVTIKYDLRSFWVVQIISVILKL